jgi:tetratricopeptide (TPR) repeat protein
MYENAVALDPDFARAHAGVANVCAQYYYHFEQQQQWIDRAIAAAQKASSYGKDAPEIKLAEAWIEVAEGRHDQGVNKVREAISRDPDIDGGYYLLGRALFLGKRYQEIVDMMEEALEHAGENYNTLMPIHNALGALGKKDALNNFLHREIAIYEGHVKKVPEDARARILLAQCYALHGRAEDGKREADMAMALRPDDTMVLYNVACLLCLLNKPKEALVTLRKAKETGYRTPAWVRQDPDLAILHGEPEFEEMYPADDAAPR